MLQRYGYRPLTYPVKAVKEDIEEIKEEEDLLEKDIAAMQSEQATNYLKSMVQQWKEDQKMQLRGGDIFNDLLNIMFSEKGGW